MLNLVNFATVLRLFLRRLISDRRLLLPPLNTDCDDDDYCQHKDHSSNDAEDQGQVALIVSVWALPDIVHDRVELDMAFLLDVV